MTIKGVSDQIRLPRKGIIKIGEKDEKKGFPKALDHFVGPKEFHEKYGAEPREIPILFPFDLVGMNYDESLKAYKSGGKLFCRGDGEVATRSDGKGGMIEMECPFYECSYFKKKECKQVGVLSFLIPEISITGCYQVWTSSRSSMENLRSTLTQLYSMFKKLSGIPMKLRVVMQKARPWVPGQDGEVKPMTTEVPIIHSECDLPLQQVQVLAARNSLALLPGESMDPDTYPDTLYSKNEHVRDDAEKTDDSQKRASENEPGMFLHPIVERFLKYDEIVYSITGTDICSHYMTVKDKVTGETRKPTLEQIKGWQDEREIKYLSGILSKIENDHPEVKNA